METFDAIVVGLGAMGSAAAFHLANSGARVLGVDRLSPPHSFGSSHGDTRITRLAVAEGAAYVPLVRRSHQLWRELEAASGLELFVECGGLVMGVPDSTGQHGVDSFAAATREIAVEHAIGQEVLTASEIRDRYHVFNVHDEVGYFEPTAGYLLARSCISAHLMLARRHGATLMTDACVTGWSSTGSTVSVEVSGTTYVGGSLVLAPGPWIEELLPEFAPSFSVQRQIQFWFEMQRSAPAFQALPIFIWMHGARTGEYAYGFPAIDGAAGGVKVATEVFGQATNPATVDRTVSRHETEAMFTHHVKRHLPDLGPTCLRAEVCLYTVTKDFGFVVDRHPAHDNVVIASPCSGHGFKHAAAVGECVAALALGETSPVDLAPFSITRFTEDRLGGEGGI